MELTIDILIEEAKAFSQMLSAQNHSSLIGVTDGKGGRHICRAFVSKPSKQEVYNDRWQQRFRH